MSGKTDDDELVFELQRSIAAELVRPIELPNPAAGGEKLSAFIQRAIVSNPFVEMPARSCRSFGLDPRMPRIFCPAFATDAALRDVHAGLEALQSDPAVYETGCLFDAMWTIRPRGALPLSLRMAQLPPIVLDAVETGEVPRTYTPLQHRLDLARLATRRRDTVAVQLFEHLRAGTVVASAFSAGDGTRAMHNIPTGWWDDPAVECHWKDDELRPTEGAAFGTPYYRGLTLLPGGYAAASSLPDPAPLTPVSPSCSDHALKEFYQARVTSWPADRPVPSGKDDTAAALAHFGSERAPSRERLRDIRRKIAPSDWQIGRGRPKKSRP